MSEKRLTLALMEPPYESDFAKLTPFEYVLSMSPVSVFALFQ